jgi:hypothetical protein
MAARRQITAVLGPPPVASLTGTSAVLPGVLLPLAGADQMRGLPSTAAHRGVQEVRLPAGVEKLLVNVVADGFTLFCCGPKAAPNGLVACYQWDRWVDLLTIRDFERVITARVPTRGGNVDIFAPEVVVWAYEGRPQHAVRAWLELVHPETSRCPHRGVSGAGGLARSPRPATPDDHQTAVTRAGWRAGRPAGLLDEHPSW